MKKVIVVLAVCMVMATSGFTKERDTTSKSGKEEIAEFRQEYKKIENQIAQHENTIQRLKYRIAQLIALIDYVENKEKDKKKSKKKKKEKK